jgi:hypothetical protein
MNPLRSRCTWNLHHAHPIVAPRTTKLSADNRGQPRLELLEDRQLPSAISFLTAPVVPVITPALQAHLAAIHTRGLELGNRDNAFSRVGDSISASLSFLTPVGGPTYGLSNAFLLGKHSDLAPLIAYFRSQVVDSMGQNSFNHLSFAAHPGWRTDSLLVGFPGATPLSMEMASTHPSIALIMIGTNDAAGLVDPAVFRANLELIVDITASMGVIPVLSTIPDISIGAPLLEARVLAFNQVIADVASELEVPLWNYWLAMQSLPNRGLSADGVHPSSSPFGAGVLSDVGIQGGYNLRNLTALEVLASLEATVFGNTVPTAAAVNGRPAVATETIIFAGLTSGNVGPLLAQGTGEMTVSGSALASTAVAVTPTDVLPPVRVTLTLGQESGGGTVAETKPVREWMPETPPEPPRAPELLPTPGPAAEPASDVSAADVIAMTPASQTPSPAVPVDTTPSRAPDEGSDEGSENLAVLGALALAVGLPRTLVDDEIGKEHREHWVV